MPQSKQRQTRCAVKAIARESHVIVSSCPVQVLKWILLFSFACVSAPVPTSAQLPQIRLYSLFPAGGQIGTTVDVTVTSGVDLEGLSGLVFSHPDMVAVPKTDSAEDGSPSPPHTFNVTIPRDVRPGVYDVRAVGRYGMSNPRSFEVGSRKETRESEPNGMFENATAIEVNSTANASLAAAADVDVYRFVGKKGQRIMVECRAAGLDSRLLGTIEVFDKRGSRLAQGAGGSDGDPILDLTLPDDGEYYLKVLDQIYRGGHDFFYRLHLFSTPFVDFVIPPAGLAGSRETFTVYGRNLPNGTASGVESNGHLLEKLEVRIGLPEDETLLQLDRNARSFQADRDRIMYALKSNGLPSNRIPVHFASAPIAFEIEPNDTPASAQPLTLPVEVMGQFQAPGDIDYMQFEAKAQDVFWINVSGHRDGTGVDPYLIVQQVIVDDDGQESGARQIAVQDDIATDLFPSHFDTRNNDVSYRFTAPADSQYRISLRDRYFESRGGPQLIYRLAIRRGQPDFRLVVVPFAPRNGQNYNTASAWPIGLRRGDNFAVRVLALRQDGFDGSIAIEVEGLPEGVSCQAANLGPGQSQTIMVFSASEDAPSSHCFVRVHGRAEIGSHITSDTHPPAANQITRCARTGTIVWDGNQERPARSRLSRGLGLCVIDELAPLQVNTDVTRIEVNRNRQILFAVSLAKRNGFDSEVTFAVEGLPPNAQADIKPIPTGADHQWQRIFVPPNVPLGTFTLLLRGQAQVAYSRSKGASREGGKAAQDAKPENLAVAAPARAIVIHIKEHPATLTVSVPGDGSIKRGGDIDIPVKVNRVNGFQGPVTLTLPIPPEVQGLSAAPVTLAADQTDGILKVAADEAAAAGPLANLVVRADMSFNGDAAVDQPITLKVVE